LPSFPTRRSSDLYLVYLRGPTGGGVFASWASLGHVTVAEPGALIGFLGPVVYQTLHGEPFPAGVQKAEHLVARGIVDAVVRNSEPGAGAASVLAFLSRHSGPVPAPGDPPAGELAFGEPENQS